MSVLPRLVSVLLCVAFGLVGAKLRAEPVDPKDVKQRTEALPKRLNGIDVAEHPGDALPLRLGFADTSGRRVSLGDYFRDDLPVIVTLNYSNCPMLCSLMLNGLVEGLKQVDLTVGKDYRIVTVSLDPRESWQTAQRTQDRYTKQYGRPGAKKGWEFLTGSEANIKALAAALGVSYGYNEERDEYVHPASLAIATPDGRIGRYLYGVEYHPKTLRLSLIETSQGKIGTTVDHFILYCFHYDETEGRYAPVAMNIMRVAAGTAAILLGGLLVSLWRLDLRKKRKLAERTA